jgi:Flp pilus assembly protein TadD
LEQLRQANRAFYTGDIERAVELLEPLRNLMSQSPALHALLARCYLVQGRADRALPHARRAADRGPLDPLHHSLLGDAELRLRRVSAAVDAYQRAVDLSPDMAPALVGLVWRASLDGDLQGARERARRARELAPAGFELRIRLAYAWENLNQPALAAEVLREAIELRPDSERAHMALAIQLASLGDEAGLERELALAGETADDPRYRSRLDVAYARRGETRLSPWAVDDIDE